jgi:hypothetical protein
MTNDFPMHLRRVREIFDMEAQTVVFATCPNCFATYPPEKQGNILAYPPRCSYQIPFQEKPCHNRLTTQQVRDGESVRVPIQPFVMQDFDAFVAGLLSRRGMEEILEKGSVCEPDELLSDVKDGNLLRDIPGADGQPFMGSTSNGELRLAWSLCVDWFNPYQNKAVGKSASTGSIVMACLNLPPHLRYKPENLYLVGILPKREPTSKSIIFCPRLSPSSYTRGNTALGSPGHLLMPRGDYHDPLSQFPSTTFSPLRKSMEMRVIPRNCSARIALPHKRISTT